MQANKCFQHCYPGSSPQSKKIDNKNRKCLASCMDAYTACMSIVVNSMGQQTQKVQ